MAKTPKRRKNAKARKPERVPGKTVVLGPATEKTHTIHGRFKKGNPGGPGNPVFRELHKTRESLVTALRSFDPVHVFEVLKAMYIAATVERNTAAAKIWLEYLIGKPAVTILLQGEGGMKEKLLEYVQKGITNEEVIKAVEAEVVTTEKRGGG